MYLAGGKHGYGDYVGSALVPWRTVVEQHVHDQDFPVVRAGAPRSVHIGPSEFLPSQTLKFGHPVTVRSPLLVRYYQNSTNAQTGDGVYEGSGEEMFLSGHRFAATDTRGKPHDKDLHRTEQLRAHVSPPSSREARPCSGRRPRR